MKRTAILASLAYLLIACGGAPMDGGASPESVETPEGVDAHASPDSAPAPVVGPVGSDGGSPSNRPDAGPGPAPHVDAAPPGVDAAPPKTDAAPGVVVDAGPVDTWGPPYSDEFCANLLHLDAAACARVNDLDARVRATGWLEGQCVVGYQPAISGCGQIQFTSGATSYPQRLELVCHNGIWRTLGRACTTPCPFTTAGDVCP